MLNQGLLLLVAGMGTVFVFLALMVVVMQAAGKFFMFNEARFKDAATETNSRKAATGENTEIIAAVLAAIKTHLRK